MAKPAKKRLPKLLRHKCGTQPEAEDFLSFSGGTKYRVGCLTCRVWTNGRQTKLAAYLGWNRFVLRQRAESKRAKEREKAAKKKAAGNK